MNDTRPFPIQAESRAEPASSIPWWLAEVAYKYYHERWPEQSLERLAERRGFGRAELVALIRRENP